MHTNFLKLQKRSPVIFYSPVNPILLHMNLYYWKVSHFVNTLRVKYRSFIHLNILLHHLFCFLNPIVVYLCHLFKMFQAALNIHMILS